MAAARLPEMIAARALIAERLPDDPELRWIFERLDREIQAAEMNDPIVRARMLAAHHRAMA